MLEADRTVKAWQGHISESFQGSFIYDVHQKIGPSQILNSKKFL